MHVFAVLNDQQIHEEHMLPFPTDLNQTTTMDAMQTRDGKKIEN